MQRKRDIYFTCSDLVKSNSNLLLKSAHHRWCIVPQYSTHSSCVRQHLRTHASSCFMTHVSVCLPHLHNIMARVHATVCDTVISCDEKIYRNIPHASKLRYTGQLE